MNAVVEFVCVYTRRVDWLSSLALSMQESSVSSVSVARGLPISCRALMNVDLSGGRVTAIDLIVVTFTFLCQ